MMATIQHDHQTGWYNVMVEGDTVLETRELEVALSAVLWLRRQ